jgi:NADPH-dependent 2,4-dienoyl-CoA reductase/sulfur reductase-like enzyme/rhodanese-related sulfurtransferase
MPGTKLRLLIVGGVAGGATAAARARRISEAAEITVVERGPAVSYANCGLPYFISGEIDRRSKLILQTPEGFSRRYRVTVRLQTEAIEIDRAGRRVLVRGPEGEAWLPYDALILAQGGNPVAPEIPGTDAPHVFSLWTVSDMDRLHEYLEREHPKTAVVVGGGFVGLEMAEAFRKRGLATTVVELASTVMPTMDPDFGVRIAHELESHGVTVITGARVRSVGQGVELSDGRKLPADLVLFSVGVRPELALARGAGLEVGATGGLLVDDRLRTSDPHIYAAGDMVEVEHKVSGRKVRVPLAGPANRQGRIAASNALGLDLRYSGALGTSVVRVFDATVASTGLSERAARDAGFAVGVVVIHRDDHAGYFPGARQLCLELVYDRTTARVLGAQAFGPAGVDKRIDVVATALQGKLTLHDLAELDLAYAPQFSSANDALNIAAFAGINDISGFSPLCTATQLKQVLAAGERPVLLDVRTSGEYQLSHLQGAMHVPVDELRDRCDEIPSGARVFVYCGVGYRAHLAARILRERGFDDVTNVTGGLLSLRAEGGFEWEEA